MVFNLLPKLLTGVYYAASIIIHFISLKILAVSNVDYKIDYILVKTRFRSGVNIHRTRSFPGADIGSDHDLSMMTFRVRLKKARQPNQPRLRFGLEKLRDLDVTCTFEATIGGKFAPLTGLIDADMDMNTMITTYNRAVTDAPNEILGKERSRKKPWVTKDVLDLCDERKDLK